MTRDVRSRTLPAPAGAWQVDRPARELLIDGRRTRLAEKPFRVLEALLERPGEVVTREELRRRLWPGDTFVDFDNNLNTAVASVRHALGDSARAPRCVETIPRVGYRLIVPAGQADATGPEPPAAGAPRFSIALVAAAAAAIIVALIATFALWPRPAAVVEAGHAGAASPEAAALFARGEYLRAQAMATGKPELLEQARAAFQAAAEADPGFAAAVAEEAETMVEMAFVGLKAFPDAMGTARRLAERALTVENGTPAAHRVLGLAALLLDWDADGAGRYLDESERLAPSHARTAMARATYESALGRHDAAIDAARRAVALEPGSYYVRADLAFFYLAAGRNGEAAASSRDVLDVEPDFEPALVYAVAANERLGRWEQAARDARRLMALGGAAAGEIPALDQTTPRDAVRAWRQWDLARTVSASAAAGRADDYAFQLALKHAAVGDRSAALDYLERAHRHRAAMLVFVRAFPELESLHGDPRFERIANAISSTS